ncbi:hypothetical protein TL16_g06917 [Triparma laevis f. inornata]|uniref:CDAN1-interacting nuclease 1 n=1 Tax=Triparma laevis f. inornata TaxID=1714386 RepID=A0A9W7ASP7_9STRA|nr:hypothetical protein TL16_g06917 [Triparma laevis f. inornata]
MVEAIAVGGRTRVMSIMKGVRNYNITSGGGGEDLAFGRREGDRLELIGGEEHLQYFYKSVESAILIDPLNGPLHDRYRRQIGLDYELLLQHQLSPTPHLTESSMRISGFSKTPDILLLTPVRMEVGGKWMNVCWIDSKAMYGDPLTHKNNLGQVRKISTARTNAQ